MDFESSSLQQLVEHHLRLDIAGTERGVVSNEILRRVSSGSDLALLKPLFDAGGEQRLRTVTFVLSEVGSRSIEAMDWLSELLENESPWIRHYSVVAVHHSGSLVHPEVTARALRKLYDARAVRLAAVRFAAHGSLRQIETAIPYLPEPTNDAAALLVEGRLKSVESASRSSDIGVAHIELANHYRLGLQFDIEDSSSLNTELSDAAEWIERTPIRSD